MAWAGKYAARLQGCQPLQSNPTKRIVQKHGCLRLLAASLTIAIIWTIFLPYLGSRSPLRESIRRRQALGVNADAMFYTELEAMETLIVRWNSGHQERRPTDW